MTCDEYLATLSTASLGEPAAAREHAAGCADCARVTGLAVARERGRHRHLDRAYAAASALAIAAVVWVAASRVNPRDLAPRAATAARPTAVELIPLRCVSGPQLGQMLREQLGREGTAAFRGEQPHAVLTVRGTPDQVRAVRALVERQEAACAR
jgi:hypothetical protein